MNLNYQEFPLYLTSNQINTPLSLDLLPAVLVLENLPIAMAVANYTNYSLIYSNQQFRQIFPKQNISKLDECFQAESWQLVLKNLTKDNEFTTIQLPLYTKYGRLLSGLLYFKQWAIGDEELFIVTLHNFNTSKRWNKWQTFTIITKQIMEMIYRYRNQKNYSNLEFISKSFPNFIGYSSLEINNNKNFYHKNLVHPDEQEIVSNSIEKAIEKKQSYNLEYRLITKSGEQKWVWDQGIGQYNQKGELLFIEGLLIDISTRKKIEQEIQLLHNLTEEISQAPDFEEALAITLRQVCLTTKWDFGEAWIPCNHNQELHHARSWYSQEIDTNDLENDSYCFSLAEFSKHTEGFTFPASVGLPGKIWSSRQPLWIPDVSCEELFVRQELAQKCGLKAGFGVPIIAKKEVVAILVFFIRESKQQDQQLVNIITTVARQLGSLMRYKQTEAELKESQRQLSSLVNAIPGVFFKTSNHPGWKMSYVSQGCQELTGYTYEELIHNGSFSFDSIVHPDDLPVITKIIDDSIVTKKPYVMEYRIYTKEQKEKWVWEKGQAIFDEKENLLGLEGFITDITERKQMEVSLSIAEAKYRSIFENALEGIFQTTVDGKYLSANPALAKIYGYNSPTELIQSLTDIEHQLYVDTAKRAEFVDLLQTHDFVAHFESQIYRRDGQIIWISENARAVRNEQGDLLYYEGTVEDITERKQAREQLRLQAFYDPLTQLPNRAFFMQNLNSALQKAKEAQKNNPYDSYKFAILFLDLDRFKVVNDSLGHLVGDQLLIAIARRLQNCVRERDTVARLGGDEFTILLENIPDLKQAIRVAERIQKDLSDPFSIEGNKLFTGVSIGIFFSDQLDTSDQSQQPIVQYKKAEDLLRDADTALYRAKALGKGCYQIFDQTMHQQAVALLQLETDLRQALNRQEFALYYQPIFSLVTGKLTGFEALLRWQHPTKGIIAPNDFISTAEETGLIIPIGIWVLRQACFQFRQWQIQPEIQELFAQEDLTISVNLSVKQFARQELVNDIKEVLKETQLDPHYLKLEITESCWVNNEDTAKQKLQQLRALGIHLCIDDFGTGYSSLNYLHQLPIDSLKLDRSFISQITKDEIKNKIATAIFQLANALELEAIAEGIESLEQFQHLETSGCKLGQGYFFSKPLEANQVIEQILNNFHH